MKIFSLCTVMLLFSGCSAGSFKNEVKTKGNEAISSNQYKSSLTVCDAIKNSVPKEMHYAVLLQSIISLIKNEYVNELDDIEITEKALTGLLSSLDPHSCFLNEKSLTILMNQTDGEFVGLGIEIIVEDGFIRIISPIDDCPAYKAGIKAGDVILYIDDECINGISSEDALFKLRGKVGSKIKLKIKRYNKDPFDITIKRDVIKIQSVKTEVYENIGYIRISTFDKNTSKILKEFLSAAKNRNLKGYILDVRNNPGGLLDEAVAVADIFLNGGKIVETRGKTPENNKVFTATKMDLANGKPIVLLINSSTASAPEILAGALRDNKRAILVGTRSFGKGSVQKIIPLSEKAALKLTVAKHFTPSGECIQSNGITPDILVESSFIKKPILNLVMREENLNNALDAEKNLLRRKEAEENNRKSLEEFLMKKDKKEDEIDEELQARKLSLKDKINIDLQLNAAFSAVNVAEKLNSIRR